MKIQDMGNGRHYVEVDGKFGYILNSHVHALIRLGMEHKRERDAAWCDQEACKCAVQINTADKMDWQANKESAEYEQKLWVGRAMILRAQPITSDDIQSALAGAGDS